MDSEQPVTVQAPAPAPQVSQKHGGWKRTLLMLLAAVLLLAAGAGGGWWWRNKNAKDAQNADQLQISSLQTKNNQLTKDLAAANKATTTATTAATTGVAPNATTLDSIKASITSGNTAALAGYMATTVKVTMAAAATSGDRTPTQAVSDITTYIKSATSPWSFDIPAATLAKYQAGTYKQYFPTTATVGQSANNYVISFQYDASSKISGVYMTNDASTLE